jgi:integrase
VQCYVTKRLGEVSAGSVIRELGILKHLLSFAVEHEIIPSNPAASVKPPKPAAGRVRYLQPTELKALLELCPAWLQPIVALAVTTGMRRGEILGLRWMDIDFGNSMLWLPQTKNGTGRGIHLNKIAIAALESIQPHGEPSQLVFQANADYVGQTFRQACSDAGIADFRFHDLRHTAASRLAMSGADALTIARTLGHKDLRMTARYAHLSPGFLGEAVGRLDGVFGDLRCHSVANQKLLEAENAVTVESKSTANGTRTRTLRLESANHRT